MRATPVGRNRKGQPIVLMRLYQGAEMRKRYIAHIPRWRQPLIGYVFTFPLVALAIALTLLMQKMLPHYYFPGAMLLLAIVLEVFI